MTLPIFTKIRNENGDEITVPSAEEIFGRPAPADTTMSIAHDVADQVGARLLASTMYDDAPARNAHAASKPAGGPASDAPIRQALAGIMSAQAILDTKYPPQQWAVPDLVPQGTTFVVGPPKLGKSIFSLGLAVAVASGGMALGSIPCEAGSVLYLALEDGPRRIQARLRALTNGSVSDRLSIATSWPRLDAGGLEAIDAWISAHGDARMVIVDTLKMLRPLRASDTQSVYNADYDVVEPLTRLASERVALVIVHHTRKAVADDPLASVSGSFGLTGAADGVLVLSRSRTRADATLSVIGRDLPERELALKFDGQLATWQAVGDAADVRRSAERQEILAHLRAAPEAVGPAAIAAALGRRPDAVRQTLGRMLSDGEITMPARGKYTVVTPPSDECHNRKPISGNDLSPKVTVVTDVTADYTGDGPPTDPQHAVTTVTTVTTDPIPLPKKDLAGNGIVTPPSDRCHNAPRRMRI